MLIKNGFNNKPTRINFEGRDNRVIEVWIEETGSQKIETEPKDTLSYMTIEEAATLKRELETALRTALSL